MGCMDRQTDQMDHPIMPTHSCVSSTHAVWPTNRIIDCRPNEDPLRLEIHGRDRLYHRRRRSWPAQGYVKMDLGLLLLLSGRLLTAVGFNSYGSC